MLRFLALLLISTSVLALDPGQAELKAKALNSYAAHVLKYRAEHPTGGFPAPPFQLKTLPDPRERLAFLCGSPGGPEPKTDFTAAKLDAELEDYAKTFINDARRNFFSPREKKLYLSTIFRAVFASPAQAKAFVAPRMAKSKAEEKAIVARDTDVEFLGK